MYANDSFYTLTGAGQTGLIILSGLLAAVFIGAAVWLYRRVNNLAGRALLAVLIFWLFAWIAPQIYYFYYLLLFEDLPVQMVIGLPPGPVAIAKILLFDAQATLSDHARAMLGWALVVLSWINFRRH